MKGYAKSWFMGGFLSLFCILSAIGQGEDVPTISLVDIQSIPAALTDTGTYQLSFVVVNEDPAQSVTQAISLHLSVNGDAATEMITLTPANPLQPGDSLGISVPDHQFAATRFLGGGITHDIIVWPMVNGSGDPDTLVKVVTYQHSPASLSTRQGAEEGNEAFPKQVYQYQSYDLSFWVVNTDPVRYLYHPVTMWLQVNEQSMPINAQAAYPPYPIAPGDSFEVAIEDYGFTANLFGSGGITHDIIVWPMSLGSTGADSLFLTVRFFPHSPTNTGTQKTNPGSPAKPTLKPGTPKLPAPPPPSPVPGTMAHNPYTEAYPNPFSDRVQFLLKLPHADQLTLTLYSLDGRKVWQARQKLQAGSQAWQANLSGLPAGHYQYQIKGLYLLRRGTLIKVQP